MSSGWLNGDGSRATAMAKLKYWISDAWTLFLIVVFGLVVVVVGIVLATLYAVVMCVALIAQIVVSVVVPVRPAKKCNTPVEKAGTESTKES